MSSQDIYVLVETLGDSLADATLESLGAGRELAGTSGGKVVAVALGPNNVAKASELIGADQVIAIGDAALGDYAPAECVAVIEALVKQGSPRAVLIGSTSFGIDVAPMLASRLGAPVLNSCQKIALDGDTLKVTASLCAGKMLADVEVAAAPAILLVAPGAYAAVEGAGSPEVVAQECPVPLEGKKVVFEQMVYPEAGDVDITKEEILVGVGRGVQQEDNMELVTELAEALGGQLCASRPVVDQGWLPTTRQVGKSGMIVKPKCYFALGMSGAPEHTEGMKDSELIIAINTDEAAPIFEVAHYGIVGDMLDLVPAITEAIKAKS